MIKYAVTHQGLRAHLKRKVARRFFLHVPNTCYDPTENVPVFLHLFVMLLNGAPVCTVNLGCNIYPSKWAQFHSIVQMTLAALIYFAILSERCFKSLQPFLDQVPSPPNSRHGKQKSAFFCMLTVVTFTSSLSDDNFPWLMGTKFLLQIKVFKPVLDYEIHFIHFLKLSVVCLS